MHPQQALHQLSLLSNKNDSTSQEFWMNAALDIDWIKKPKVAHDGKEVSTGAAVAPLS